MTISTTIDGVVLVVERAEIRDGKVEPIELYYPPLRITVHREGDLWFGAYSFYTKVGEPHATARDALHHTCLRAGRLSPFGRGDL